MLYNFSERLLVCVNMYMMNTNANDNGIHGTECLTSGEAHEGPAIAVCIQVLAIGSW